MGPLDNLSLEVAAQVDIEDGELGPTDGSEDSLYAQPSLKDKPDEREPFPYRRETVAKDTQEATREVVGSVTLDPETLEMVQAADDPKKSADYFM